MAATATEPATMRRFLIRYHQGQPDDYPKAAEALTFEGACRQCGWDPAECTGQVLKADPQHPYDWEDVDTSFIPNHFTRRPGGDSPLSPPPETTPAPAATKAPRRIRKADTVPVTAAPPIDATPAAQGVSIPLSQLQPNPWQPPGRLHMPQDKCEQMADDILSNGLHYAIKACSGPDGMFIVPDGWQRRCAYAYLNDNLPGADLYASIPADVREFTDVDLRDIVWSANQVRRSMTPIDLAHYYRRCLEEHGLTQGKLAGRLGITQPEVSNTMRLLDLPDVVQTQISAGEISETIGVTILQIKDPKKRTQYAQQAVAGRLTVAELNDTIKEERWKTTKNLDPKVYGDDKPAFDLVACVKCEHRVMLNQYGKAEPRCEDPPCWKAKQKEVTAVLEKAVLDRFVALGITRVLTNHEAKQTAHAANYEMPNSDPACAACEKRAAVPVHSPSLYIQVCLDPQCARTRKKAENDTLSVQFQRETVKKKAQEQAAIEAAFAGADVTNEQVALLTIEALVRARRSHSVMELLGLEMRGYEAPHVADFLKAVRSSKLTPFQLLPRLAYACLKDQTYGDQETSVMLKRFTELGTERPSPVPIPEATTVDHPSPRMVADDSGEATVYCDQATLDKLGEINSCDKLNGVHSTARGLYKMGGKSYICTGSASSGDHPGVITAWCHEVVPLAEYKGNLRPPAKNSPAVDSERGYDGLQFSWQGKQYVILEPKLRESITFCLKEREVAANE